MLRRWRDNRQANGAMTSSARSPSSDGMSGEHAEVGRLEKELARVQMERDILRNPPPAGSPPVAVETVVLLWLWRGAADCFLVAMTPSKNVAHGPLRT
jgi:transposase